MAASAKKVQFYSGESFNLADGKWIQIGLDISKSSDYITGEYILFDAVRKSDDIQYINFIIRCKYTITENSKTLALYFVYDNVEYEIMKKENFDITTSGWKLLTFFIGLQNSGTKITAIVTLNDEVYIINDTSFFYRKDIDRKDIPELTNNTVETIDKENFKIDTFVVGKSSELLETNLPYKIRYFKIDNDHEFLNADSINGNVYYKIQRGTIISNETFDLEDISTVTPDHTFDSDYNLYKYFKIEFDTNGIEDEEKFNDLVKLVLTEDNFDFSEISHSKNIRFSYLWLDDTFIDIPFYIDKWDTENGEIIIWLKLKITNSLNFIYAYLGTNEFPEEELTDVYKNTESLKLLTFETADIFTFNADNYTEDFNCLENNMIPNNEEDTDDIKIFQKNILSEDKFISKIDELYFYGLKRVYKTNRFSLKIAGFED